MGRVIRLAVLNGVNLFNLVMLNWTGIRWVLVLFGIVLVLYGRAWPTRQHCIAQLSLSGDEVQKLFR
jgi:hypothetical protein